MTKREDLISQMYSRMCLIGTATWLDAEQAIDSVIDELMESDPEAIDQTATALLLMKSDVYDCWQAILTHIKAGK